MEVQIFREAPMKIVCVEWKIIVEGGKEYGSAVGWKKSEDVIKTTDNLKECFKILADQASYTMMEYGVLPLDKQAQRIKEILKKE